MGIPDLILVHPASTYRNPSSFSLHGMLTASVPSTPAAELYPIGFLSIAAYLEKHGYRVAIRNIALATSLLPRIRPALLHRYLRARVVGIDLHWATNIDGTLEIAKLVKVNSPQTPVVVGGLTASFFWKELLNVKDIDFVIRGDSAELPFLKLLEALRRRKGFRDVPNLAWRDSHERIQTNGLEYVPESLDPFPQDYSLVVRSAARSLDPVGALLTVPYRDWLINPAAALITQKGCPHNCVFCGGSVTAYATACNRRGQAFKSPPALLKDIESIVGVTRAPIYLIGDLRDPGEVYASEIFRLYGEGRFRNPLVLETLKPADLLFFKKAVEAAPGGVSYMFTADTHDDELRARFGRDYTTDQIEATIRDALQAGCRSVLLFFGIGLPGQDASSVMGTVEYCGELLERFRNLQGSGPSGLPRKRFFPFISTYLPFIEPASRAYRDSARFGYRNLAPAFRDLAKVMVTTSWAESLAYSSETMDRETIVETTYSALKAMNRIHERHGLLTHRARVKEERRLEEERTAVMSGLPARRRWLQGESSLYAPGMRRRFSKILQFRPIGVLRECSKGIWEGVSSPSSTRKS